MKKIIAIVLASLMMFAMAACGTGSNTNETEPAPTTVGTKLLAEFKTMADKTPQEIGDALMTNEEIIDVNQHSHSGKQAYRDENTVIWTAISSDDKPLLAVFNVSDKENNIKIDLNKLGLTSKYILRDLWKKEDITKAEGAFECAVNSHGAKIFKLK